MDEHCLKYKGYLIIQEGNKWFISPNKNSQWCIPNDEERMESCLVPYGPKLFNSINDAKKYIDESLT